MCLIAWFISFYVLFFFFFFFSSRRRHTRLQGDWSSDVCSSDLPREHVVDAGKSVRGRRALVEDEEGRSLAALQPFLEGLHLAPELENPLFRLGQVEARRDGEEHVGLRAHSRLRIRVTRRVSRGSASAAVARTRGTSMGSSASGRQRSVTTESASTRMPPCTATIVSGTTDIPTRSAPAHLRNRYSARVSRLGPATPAKTPSRSGILSSRAVSRASANSSLL